ncbi:claudin domain-containing protein 1 [Octopus bimaculoides]|uniref:Claudin n=1 Tax=Octopus bimaculoides TaxID=37653 RepID=A0A0L8GUZ9_OCTBM|nr:claudin domain-containing protein 1 [Octopus bimaculoides]|eukprot:XP_014777906.1 PREDICTED: claudin domain-containing protein 1-like [Octopus bimaculoides]
MPSSQTVWMLIAWSLGLIALALIGTSIGTDYWYQFSSTGSNKMSKVTNVGMWRTCTKVKVSDGWHQKECENVILFGESAELTEIQETLLYINRSFVIFVCLSAFTQFISKVIFFCAVPACCHVKKKVILFFILSVLELMAAFLGIIGCICFIALEDLGKYHTSEDNAEYQWSFMLAWISIGLCFVESSILVILVKVCYDEVFESGKFDYYSM